MPEKTEKKFGARMRAALDAIHRVVGEAPESDDGSLADRAALLLRERDERIAESRLDLKRVLMEVGNKLVLEHGFDPLLPGNVYERDRTTVTVELRTTHFIALLTTFFNQHPEAREALAAVGMDWSMPEAKPLDLKAGECGNCGCQPGTHPVSANAVGFKGCATWVPPRSGD